MEDFEKLMEKVSEGEEVVPDDSVKDDSVKAEEAEGTLITSDKDSPEPKDDDNAEKSRLGRKVKQLEEIVMRLSQLTEEQQNTIKSLTVDKPKEDASVVEDLNLDEDIATVADVIKVIDKLEKIKTQKQQEELKKQRQQYESVYNLVLTTGLSQIEDEELREEIAKTWKEKYNISYSNYSDAVSDAIKGLFSAQLEVMAKKSKQHISPQKPTVPSSISTTSPNLSQEVLEMAEFFKMKSRLTDDDIKGVSSVKTK